VLAFIDAYGRITKDSIAGPTGEPLARMGWQRELVKQTFARDPRTGRRLYRTAYWSMGRKNGKTGLVAVVALDGLFDEDGAEVYSCAGEREQAKIALRAAKRTVELDPFLSSALRTYRDAIENPANGAVYRALSSEAYSKEGYSPTRVIADELHAWEDRELYDVMALAMGARVDPLMLIVTTAGVRTDRLGGDSICYQLYQHGVRVATGEINDPTFYFAVWEAPEELDPFSTAAKRASNPGLGVVLDPTELDDQANKAQTGGMALSQYRIKRLNQWVNTAEAALPAGVFERRAVERRLRVGETIVAFLDGSYSGDSTALVGCTLDGFIDVIGAWERPPDDTHWRVDIGAVELACSDACQDYRVLELCCDPYRWQRSMQAMEAAGLPIVEYNTGSPQRMVPAWAKFYDAVTTESRPLSHSGDPRLVRHIYNMKLKVDRLGPRPVKEHKGSPRHIDLGVAAVGAFDRATELAGVPKSESIYEHRRLQVI
jgi:phage terminase large subunit-like protein